MRSGTQSPGLRWAQEDIEGKQTYLGSCVWQNPRLDIEEYDIPKPAPGEVLVEVKACGICGSDVYMARPDGEGHIFYPGLTGFPTILGHELSGVEEEAGPGAFDKMSNQPYVGGEAVCAEEMLWCGRCRPCVDGYPNHCERLDEVPENIIMLRTDRKECKITCMME